MWKLFNLECSPLKAIMDHKAFVKARGKAFVREGNPGQHLAPRHQSQGRTDDLLSVRGGSISTSHTIHPVVRSCDRCLDGRGTFSFLSTLFGNDGDRFNEPGLPGFALYPFDSYPHLGFYFIDADGSTLQIGDLRIPVITE
jgi:hypothetical protein